MTHANREEVIFNPLFPISFSALAHIHNKVVDEHLLNLLNARIRQNFLPVFDLQELGDSLGNKRFLINLFAALKPAPNHVVPRSVPSLQMAQPVASPQTPQLN